MHGCPHEYIYNSAADLAGLTARSENFRYQTNFVVDSVSETSSGVQITGFDRLERHLLTKDGERLFLAAGVLPTTKLALKMLHHYDKSVVLKDSQYFLFPILSLRGIDDAKEARNTLAQLFMEIDDPKISARLVHLQVYSHNDMVTQALERKLWFLPGLRKSLADSLSCHLLIVQGYLHSNDSGHLKLTLHQDKARQDSLRVEAVKNQETRKKCGQVISKLWELLSSHGYYPLQAGLEVCDPGRGFHCGGTFPMQPNPIGLQTDLQGRLPGLSRVHLADASTFPSVPATTITLTAMANAYRIASFAAL
jgi:choline dehydrogenase-like flavoprotein